MIKIENMFFKGKVNYIQCTCILYIAYHREPIWLLVLFSDMRTNEILYHLVCKMYRLLFE